MARRAAAWWGVGSGGSQQNSPSLNNPQAEFETGLQCNPHAPVDTCEERGAPAGSFCAYFDQNPGSDLMSFDSVAVALVVLLQAITFDDWCAPMYSLMDSFSPYVWGYFVAIVMIGGFFVVNLFLAVIFQEFIAAQMVDKAEAESMARAEEKEAIKARQSAASAGSDDAVDIAALEADAAAPDEAVERSALLPSGHELSDGAQAAPPASQRSLCDCAPKPGAGAELSRFNSDPISNFDGPRAAEHGADVHAYEGMSLEYADNLGRRR